MIEDFQDTEFNILGMIDILPEEKSTKVPRRLKENDQIVLDYLLTVKHLSLSDIQDELSNCFDFYTILEIENMLKYV